MKIPSSSILQTCTLCLTLIWLVSAKNSRETKTAAVENGTGGVPTPIYPILTPHPLSEEPSKQTTMPPHKNQEPPISGGLGPKKPADDKIREIVKKLETDIRRMACTLVRVTNCKKGEVTALAYKEQIVNGINYFVAVNVGEKTFHAKIFEQSSTTDKLELVNVVGPKKHKDKIEYFD